MRVSVSFTPVELESRDTSGAAVVMIDCFRASTSMVRALSAGAACIHPFLSVEEALRERVRRPEALLAGERGGRRIEGFDMGNSPREFTPEAVGSREIIMTTTNGTRLLMAAVHAEKLLVGAFVNLSATVAAVSAGDEVLLACAGTEGRFSIEDALCAGMMARELSRSKADSLDDSAAFAVAACGGGWDNLRRLALSGRGAGNVRNAGLEDDLQDCLALDSLGLAATVAQEPFRVVADDG